MLLTNINSKILFKKKANDQKHKKNKISFKSLFETIKDEISKIISFKIKKNPALNQTQIIIKGATKMTDGIVKKTKAKTKKVPELHPEIKQFMEEQRKFNQSQNEKWEEQAKVNHQMSEFIKDQNKKWEEQSKVNQTILTSIQEILLRIQRIEKCPTIKKELDELE